MRGQQVNTRLGAGWGNAASPISSRVGQCCLCYLISPPSLFAGAADGSTGAWAPGGGCTSKLKQVWKHSNRLSLSHFRLDLLEDTQVRRFNLSSFSGAADGSIGATKGPMWGHPMLVLGALCSFLEPFCGHLSPNIDIDPEKLTLRYPHEGPWVVWAPGGACASILWTETTLRNRGVRGSLETSSLCS